MAKIKKHPDKECDCIFCKSKCPECNSTEIRIEYRVGYTCTNDTEDHIRLSYTWDKIELECEDCGAMLELDDEWMDKRDQRLQPLIRAISREMHLASMYSIEYKDGKVVTTPYRAASK